MELKCKNVTVFKKKKKFWWQSKKLFNRWTIWVVVIRTLILTSRMHCTLNDTVVHSVCTHFIFKSSIYEVNSICWYSWAVNIRNNLALAQVYWVYLTTCIRCAGDLRFYFHFYWFHFVYLSGGEYSLYNIHTSSSVFKGSLRLPEYRVIRIVGLIL